MEFNKEQFVTLYVAALKAVDPEALSALMVTLPDENKRETLPAVIAAIEADESFAGAADGILASLKDAQAIHANVGSDVEVAAPSVQQEDTDGLVLEAKAPTVNVTAGQS